METPSAEQPSAKIFIWLPAVLCVIAIVFRIICLDIFTGIKQKIALKQLAESPSWIGPLDATSFIIAAIAVLAVILSGILTKGWTKYPSWVRILLPVLGAATILYGLVL